MTVEAYVSAAQSLLRAAVYESSTARTTHMGDNERTCVCTNAALVTITIPFNLPIGFRSMYYATGAAGLTVDTSDVTVLGSTPNATVAQNEGIYVEVVAKSTVILVGGTS